MDDIIIDLPCIHVTPNPSRFDENITIVVKGLTSGSDYTLCSNASDERSCNTFQCIAHYTADAAGSIDVTIQPSVGGYYRGIQPMGLIWLLRSSAKNKRSPARHIRNDAVAQMEILISVYKGFIHRFGDEDKSTHQCLSRTRVKRFLLPNDKSKPASRKGSVHDITFSTPAIKRSFSESDSSKFEQSIPIFSTNF